MQAVVRAPEVRRAAGIIIIIIIMMLTIYIYIYTHMYVCMCVYIYIYIYIYICTLSEREGRSGETGEGSGGRFFLYRVVVFCYLLVFCFLVLSRILFFKNKDIHMFIV